MPGRKQSARISIVASLALITACSDAPLTEPGARPPLSHSFVSVAGDSILVFDVGPIAISCTGPFPWNESADELEVALNQEQGYAIIAFKSPGSRRALATGRREGVQATHILAGLQILESMGINIEHYFWSIGAVFVQLPPGAAPALRESPFVDYIEPQWRRVAFGTVPSTSSVGLTTDSVFWGMELVRAPEAWTFATGAGAKIMIIDAGHHESHEDLPSVPAGNCSSGSCSQPHSHATQVLGVIVARQNGIGTIGVAHGVDVNLR